MATARSLPSLTRPQPQPSGSRINPSASARGRGSRGGFFFVFFVFLGALGLIGAACGRDPAPPLASASEVTSEGESATDGTATGGATDTDAETETATESATGGDAGLQGCDGAALLEFSEDPAEPGPWPVGAVTRTIAERTVEIWYPAVVGSEASVDPVRYDLRLQLPDEEQGKIPDEANPYQDCACYRDLPLDAAHGPYPVIVFIHGTAGFRTQSLRLMTHWASRGFVVVSADHDGITLGDVLSGNFGADQAGDAGRILDVLAAPSGDLDFLAGHLDSARIGMSGHSAGGSAIAGFGGRAQVLVPMAAGGASPGGALRSTLILGGIDDAVVPYSSQQMGYASAAPSKRLLGLTAAGHLAFSDLCLIGADQGGILQIALEYGVEVPFFLIGLAQDGCGDGALDAELGLEITNAAAVAAYHEVLHCLPEYAATLTSLPRRYPEIGEYLEELL